MKFLCLCYYSEKAFKALTPGLGEELAKACEPHDRALKATGKVSLIGSLGSQNQTKVISGGQAIRPGPYARTDRPFGAFFIIDAETMDEAVRIASLHPGANIDPRYLGEGAIEVWPIEAVEAPSA
jgi:hypothetical protein